MVLLALSYKYHKTDFEIGTDPTWVVGTHDREA